MQNNTKSGGVFRAMVNSLFSHLQGMLFFIEDFLIKKNHLYIMDAQKE